MQNHLRSIASRMLLRVAPRRASERFWRTRPLEDVEYYGQSTELPYRALLVEHARRFAGARSLLELGSNSGPNLLLLADAFPGARLVGLDLNASAVQTGKRLAREHDVTHMDLRCGSVQELLREIGDREFDVVVSCGTLACITPGDLSRVLADTIRVAARGLVLMEPMADGETGSERVGEGAIWRHDLARELQRLGVSGERIDRHPVPAGPEFLNGCLVVRIAR